MSLSLLPRTKKPIQCLRYSPTTSQYSPSASQYRTPSQSPKHEHSTSPVFIPKILFPNPDLIPTHDGWDLEEQVQEIMVEQQDRTQWLEWQFDIQVQAIERQWINWANYQGGIGTWFMLNRKKIRRRVLYIIFIKFFLLIILTFQFRSQRYFISYWLFFHMLHFLHLYLFPVSSVFLMFLTFTCAPVHPSTCFHFPFHMLWFCSRPFPSYYDILYFLCFIFVTLPIYPDAVYKLMYLLSSSSVCKLTLILLLSYSLSEFPLSSQSSLLSRCSPYPLVTI